MHELGIKSSIQIPDLKRNSVFSVISEGQFTGFLESSVRLTEFGTANNATEDFVSNTSGLFTPFLLAVKHHAVHKL